jgi:uncharacterized membrane protein (DUF4010 family)
MNKPMLVPILFALGTAFFWGLYGPTIGNAQIKGVQPPDGWSPFKPYVFIGIAYLVIAIGGGLAMMFSRGNAALVMPIVFGGAVSMTAFVSYWKFRDGQISPMLWVGMLLVAFGAVIVARNTPHGHAPQPAATSSPDATSAEH